MHIMYTSYIVATWSVAVWKALKNDKTSFKSVCFAWPDDAPYFLSFRQLQHLWYHFLRKNARKLGYSYNQIFHMMRNVPLQIYTGDHKPESDKPKKRVRRAATAYKSRVWLYGVIPYVIQSNFSSKYPEVLGMNLERWLRGVSGFPTVQHLHKFNQECLECDVLERGSILDFSPQAVR